MGLFGKSWILEVTSGTFHSSKANWYRLSAGQRYFALFLEMGLYTVTFWLFNARRNHKALSTTSPRFMRIYWAFDEITSLFLL